MLENKARLSCSWMGCGGLLFDRHEPSLTRRFVVYYCSALYTQKAAQDQVDVLRAVLEAFEIHQRREPPSAGLDANAVYFLLKGKGNRFARSQIEDAVNLLANPMIGVLSNRGTSFVLTVASDVARTRFAFIAAGLANSQEED
jgi:hypothetical protein